MELERVKYMLKSYLRARLAKIERHLFYIVEEDKSELLSQAELAYAFTLYEKRKDHFNEVFFEKIPKKLNCLDAEDDVEKRISKYWMWTPGF